MNPARSPWSRLPRGRTLPDEEFERRHRLLVTILWAVSLGLPFFSLWEGWEPSHALLHALPLFGFALVASAPVAPRRARAAACSLGLLTGAALFVHAWHGLVEAHFAFFVLIVALTLYEDWAVFGLAVGFVLLHHGGLGALDPKGVYSGRSLGGSPWEWATIHAAFVAAAGAAAVVLWSHNEKVRAQLAAAVREKDGLLAKVRELAVKDALTGLPNRRAWQERMVDELRRAARSQKPLMLAAIDLDHLKSVNDGGGHHAGDRLLVEAAAAWQSAVRETDFLARLGGDEFVVLLPDCDEREAEQVLARMHAAMPPGRTFSAGAVRWHGGEAASAFLRRADVELYRAKASGGSQSAVGELRSAPRWLSRPAGPDWRDGPPSSGLSRTPTGALPHYLAHARTSDRQLPPCCGSASTRAADPPRKPQ